MSGGDPADHLDPDELARFTEGLLSTGDRARVERHLDACDSCRGLAATVIRAAGSELPAAPAEPAAAVPLLRGTPLGRYLLLERIGAGAMGVVYAAYDPELDRKVALKVLHPGAESPDARERLVREAQAMAQVSHPNVIPVFDVSAVGDDVFLAMEYVEGGTLRQWLDAEARPWRAVLAMFQQAGRGLAAAHAGGLVHRDFKPDNVLCGRDGRVRVTDFGLARASPTSAPSPARPPSGTATGAILGTPAYMSPEQRRGERADARSDQFSFCVALYEGLYRERPFAAEALDGPMRPAAAGAPVPAWVRKVLVRGLSSQSADRYPRMDALLDALARDPASVRRKLGLGALAGVCVALAFAGGRARPRACVGLGAEMEQAWNPARAEHLRLAFEGVGVPYAKGSFEGTRKLLDDYAQAWVAMRTDACQATRVRGEQSDDLLDRRIHCLDVRRDHLAALVDLFEAPTPELVERSVSAASKLPPLQGCADRAALLAAVPLPGDPAQRAHVAEVSHQIALARAQHFAGQYSAAVTTAASAERAAEPLQYPPLIGSAAFAVASSKHQMGPQDPEVVPELRRAELAADEGRDDRARVQALVLLAQVLSQRSSFAEAHQAVERASAVVARMGAPEELQSEVVFARGYIASDETRLAEAAEAFGQALQLRRKVLGADHPRVADVLINYGNALEDLGRYTESEAIYRQALDIYRRTRGSAHPDVGIALTNLADNARNRGNFDESLAANREALDVFRRALGPKHVRVGQTLFHLGNSEFQLGHLAQARAAFAEALEIAEASGDEHQVIRVSVNFAECLRALNEAGAAREATDRAFALAQRALPAAHAQWGEIWASRGADLLLAGKGAEALSAYRHAVEEGQRVLGPDHPDLLDPLLGLGDTLRALRRFDESVAALERAHRILDKIPEDEVTAGEVDFSLAKSLWESRTDVARAVSLGERARDAFAKASGDHRAQGDETTRWLRQHSPQAARR